MCLTGEADRLWSTYVDVAQDAAVSGNLVTDAHLVALMRENGVRTIRRFAGLELGIPSRLAREPGDQLEGRSRRPTRLGGMPHVPAEKARDDLEDAGSPRGGEHGAWVAVEGALRSP